MHATRRSYSESSSAMNGQIPSYYQHGEIENKPRHSDAPQPLSTNKRDHAREETRNGESEPHTKTPYAPFHVGGAHARYHATNEPQEGRRHRDCVPHRRCSAMIHCRFYGPQPFDY